MFNVIVILQNSDYSSCRPIDTYTSKYCSTAVVKMVMKSFVSVSLLSLYLLTCLVDDCDFCMCVRNDHIALGKSQVIGERLLLELALYMFMLSYLVFTQI